MQNDKYRDEPLIVRPRQACALLSIGKTKLFEMLADPHSGLERIKLGPRAVGVTMKSIRRVAEKGIS
jgi:hypothetical protein